MECNCSVSKEVEVIPLKHVPDHQVPPPLSQFAAECSGLEYDQETDEVFLYHGTNCYRRWEITRTGYFEPGRTEYSFFCTNAADAYTYARAACMRDLGPDSFNSLICEPVVLKVKFTSRTWLQVDFIQVLSVSAEHDSPTYSVAVLGPVPSSFIWDIFHCTHGRRLRDGNYSTKTFEDGTFADNIRHLKETLAKNRPDAWLLKKLGLMRQKMEVKLSGGEVPEVTFDDQLKKLKKSQARA